MPEHQPANLRAALAYARAGWSVFPCIPGEKVPAVAHGFEDATRDPGQITSWWSRNPDRNVAIATGAARGGPDVLDIDRHGDRTGFPALAEIKQAGLFGEPRAMIRTPAGGAHFYYRGSDQASAKCPARSVDFRSNGGYVVAPPSAVGGKPYVVVEHQAERSGIDWGAVKQHIDPAPERKPGPARPAGRGQNLDHLAAHVAKQKEGNRGLAQWWAAHRAIEAGRDDLLPALAAAAVSAGRSAREAEATNRSALRHAPQAQERETVRLTAAAAEGRTAARELGAKRDAVAQAGQQEAAGDTARQACTLADPCHEQDCGPCYPDRVMQQEQVRERPFEPAPAEMEAAT